MYISDFSSPYDGRGLSRKGYDMKLKIYKYLRDNLTDNARGGKYIFVVGLIDETESLKDHEKFVVEDEFEICL
jgi:hypothetical protein